MLINNSSHQGRQNLENENKGGSRDFFRAANVSKFGGILAPNIIKSVGGVQKLYTG